jgi:acyl carrier protein
MSSGMDLGTTATDETAVLARLAAMLRELLAEYGLDEDDTAEITMDTTFHDDLELESVDLVALSGQLREHYGDRVNFATFIAERDLDEIIALTVGELVRYIVESLRARP